MIRFSAEWEHSDDIWPCPQYTFTYNGGGWSKLSVLKYPVNIKLAPSEVFQYKGYVDSMIRAYAGDAFCSRLFFREVDVVCPDSLERFKDILGGPTTCCCRAKYNFYYEFRADSLAKQFIPVLLDSNGRIMYEFPFPSKNEYRDIDSGFTYCKLIDIAKSNEEKLKEVESIHFEYDRDRKRYFWRLNGYFDREDRKGNNRTNILIDASDLSKVVSVPYRHYSSHYGSKF